MAVNLFDAPCKISHISSWLLSVNGASPDEHAWRIAISLLTVFLFKWDFRAISANSKSIQEWKGCHGSSSGFGLGASADGNPYSLKWSTCMAWPLCGWYSVLMSSSSGVVQWAELGPAWSGISDAGSGSGSGNAAWVSQFSQPSSVKSGLSELAETFGE